MRAREALLSLIVVGLAAGCQPTASNPELQSPSTVTPLSPLAAELTGAASVADAPTDAATPVDTGATSAAQLAATLVGVTAAGATPTASLPNTTGLAPPGPYLIRRAPADPLLMADGVADLATSHDAAKTLLEVHQGDGALAATWELPDGASIRRVSDALSPDGRWLAFFSGDGPDSDLAMPITKPLTLHVWDLSGGTEAFSTPVLRAGIRKDLRRQTEQLAGQASDEDALESAEWSVPADSALAWHAPAVVQAFLDGVGDVMWSPDGRRLAFVGALDGPSGDVYVLDTDDWRVTRVSDEPTHVIHMSWSPDGLWILHEGAHYAAPAAGYTTAETTDVSAADGSSQRNVAGRSGVGGHARPWPDAWLGDSVAIVHSRSMGCGVCDLLRIDASSGITETLVGRMAAQNFAVGPSGMTAAVAGSLCAEPCSGPAAEYIDGAHIVALDGSGAEQVHDLVCRVARWDADDLPYVWLPTYLEDRCRTTAFGPDGREKPIDAPGDLADASVSPAGQWRVLYGDSGWLLYDRDSNERAAMVADVGDSDTDALWRPVDTVSWHPDETSLYWLANGHLWVAQLPDGEPRLVGSWPDRKGYRPDIDVAWWR